MLREDSPYRFIFYQLTRPFSYLLIRHDDKKVYNWLFPLLFTLISILFIDCFIEIDKVNELLSSITDFVANLPGFFIAALAAVATFHKDDIDKLMENPPKIEIIYEGHLLLIEMTRRRFLCVLFSYLTAVSILLVIVSRFYFATDISGVYSEIIIKAGAIAYLFVFWQMITATVLGLYYLGERLHTPQ